MLAFNLCSAPAERSGDGALDWIATYKYPKRCRASLATALHRPSDRAEFLTQSLRLVTHSPTFSRPQISTLISSA